MPTKPKEKKPLTKEDKRYIRKHAKNFCCSCDVMIAKENYEFNGNYCPKCLNMATKMYEIRKLFDYFSEKTCSNNNCCNGYINTSGKKKKCKICFKKYTEDEKQDLYDKLFASFKRIDLILAQANNNFSINKYII